MDLPVNLYTAVCIVMTIGAGLIAIVKILRPRKQDEEGFEPSRDKDGKLQRKLGKMERSMLSFDRMGPGSGIDVTVLLVNSKETLRPDVVEKALRLLAQKYPLLRMKVEDRQDKGFHFVETDSSLVNFDTTPISAKDWGHVFGQESQKSFEYFDRPLWRVTMLREVQEQDGLFHNALMFTFHHAVCDGGSIMALYGQFLDYVNKLHEGGEVEVESMELRPPFLHLMRDKIKLSASEKLMFLIFPWIMKLMALFSSNTNAFLGVFPAENPGTATTEKRTCIITKVIRADEMSKIIKVSKEHKCTVHGAITAAAHFAMASILNSGSSQKPGSLCKMNTSCNVAMRKECQPEIKTDEFGCFISVIEVKMQTPAIKTATPDREEFWKFAAECTSTVHGKIKKKEHLFFPKMLNNIDLSSMKIDSRDQGRWDNVFNISNRGRFDIGKDKDCTFKFGGTYFAMAEQHVGPMFVNTVVSVNGDLYWGLAYYPHIAPEKQAQELVDLTVDILMKAST